MENEKKRETEVKEETDKLEKKLPFLHTLHGV